MSPATIFQIHLVLGYVPWLLCFGAYVWPRLKSMDRVEAQRAIGTLHSFRFFGLVFIVPGNERGCSSANSYRHHEGHAEPIEIVVGALRFLRNRCIISRSLEITRRNQNRRPCLAAILRCPVVVVGKGFRASTVWASKRGKIGHPTLALKTDEHEW